MAQFHDESSTDGTAHPYGIEIFGPIHGNELFYALKDGRRVPHITLHPIRNNPEGEWVIRLDERWVMVGTDLEVRKWIDFLANAMAVAAGYVCFGTETRINPFNGPTHVRLSHGEILGEN